MDRGAEIVALTASPKYEGDLGLTSVSGLRTGMSRQAEEVLEQAAARGHRAGVSVRPLCFAGLPHEVIAEAAKREKAELVRMGVLERGQAMRLLKGNAPLRSAGFSPVDLLLVPRNVKVGFKRILLATNGWEDNRRAADKAAALAKANNGEVITASVVELSWQYMGEARATMRAARDLAEQALKKARASALA